MAQASSLLDLRKALESSKLESERLHVENARLGQQLAIAKSLTCSPSKDGDPSILKAQDTAPTLEPEKMSKLEHLALLLCRVVVSACLLIAFYIF